MMQLRKVELSERAMWNWGSWWNINVNKHYSLMQMKHLLCKIVKKWQYLKSDKVNGCALLPFTSTSWQSESLASCQMSMRNSGRQCLSFLIYETEVRLSSAAGLNYAQKVHGTIVGNIICMWISMSVTSISSVLWIIRKDVKSSGLQV